MRKNKGFTLIELMIAVAIIGILALVLIPRVAGVKDTARETGVDTNVRMGLTVAENLVDKYTSDQAGLTSLETALASALTANGASNPFSKSTAIASAAVTNGAAVYAYIADASEPTQASAVATDTDYAGVVEFDAYADASGKVKVEFMPHDKDGACAATAIKSTN